jgi:Inverse autotransporter, beta-domain
MDIRKLAVLLTMLCGCLYLFDLTAQESDSGWDMEQAEAPCEPVQPCCRQERCCLWWDPIRLWVSHVEGRNLFFKNGYTTVGLFAIPPCWQCARIQPFVDVRGHYLNDGRYAANLGGGVRFACRFCDMVIGLNTYYDYRKAHRRDLHQIGPGLEILTPCWDLRVNGYIPIGKKIEETRRKTFLFPHGKFATCRQRREAQAGVDAEIGRCFNCFCLPIYVGIGPYCYFSRSCIHDTWGGQVRLQAQWCYFTFEGGGSYDGRRHGGGYGRIGFNLPLCRRTDGCKERCYSCYPPVQRQEMIVVGERHCFWKSNL